MGLPPYALSPSPKSLAWHFKRMPEVVLGTYSSTSKRGAPHLFLVRTGVEDYLVKGSS